MIRVPLSRRQEDQDQREEVRMEAEIREKRKHDAVGFRDGREGHTPRNGNAGYL